LHRRLFTEQGAASRRHNTGKKGWPSAGAPPVPELACGEGLDPQHNQKQDPDFPYVLTKCFPQLRQD
jgi:hypothetical protein